MDVSARNSAVTQGSRDGALNTGTLHIHPHISGLSTSLYTGVRYTTVDGLVVSVLKCICHESRY